MSAITQRADDVDHGTAGVVAAALAHNGALQDAPADVIPLGLAALSEIPNPTHDFVICVWDFGFAAVCGAVGFVGLTLTWDFIRLRIPSDLRWDLLRRRRGFRISDFPDLRFH